MMCPTVRRTIISIQRLLTQPPDARQKQGSAAILVERPGFVIHCVPTFWAATLLIFDRFFDIVFTIVNIGFSGAVPTLVEEVGR